MAKETDRGQLDLLARLLLSDAGGEFVVTRRAFDGDTDRDEANVGLHTVFRDRPKLTRAELRLRLRTALAKEIRMDRFPDVHHDKGDQEMHFYAGKRYEFRLWLNKQYVYVKCIPQFNDKSGPKAIVTKVACAEEPK